MKRKLVLLLGTALCFIPGTLLAQSAPPAEDAGKIYNGYTVQNTLEFGGRITSVSGNSDMYDTLENLQSGPRLLDQSLTMRSLDHHGAIFDQLWITSFGYGGDPQAGTRLRMYKNKLYDFSAIYRSDKNIFNDNYLDNPYNTPASQGGLVVWNQALHQMNTRRQMADFHVILMPESAIRFRFGYSHNNNHGNVLSSFHEGTELSLYEDFQSRQDQYQAGVDVKVLPRTILSYDQFFDHNKTDNTFRNNPTGLFSINTGTAGAPTYAPVDIGAIYNTYYGQPCANSVASPIVTVVGGVNVVKTGVGSAACSMYFNLHRSGPTRADFPTEKLALISDYWKKLNIFATGNYTSAENDTNFRETADGFVGRTSERGFLFAGPGRVRQVSSNADLGVTFHINDAWYISNLLKYTNWRIPGAWNMTSASCGPVGAASILSPIGTLGNPYCSQLGSTNVIAKAGTNSAFTNDQLGTLDTEKRTANTTLLGWEPNRFFGAHAGFRYAIRTGTVGFGASTAGSTTTLSTTGVPTVGNDANNSPNPLFTDHEMAGLFGVKLRPTQNWMINGDVELSYIDHPVVAILPGHRQVYKLRSNYRFAKWGSISGFINNQLSRNNYFSNDFALAAINRGANPAATAATNFSPDPLTPVRHVDHNLNYGLSASLHPNEKITLDLGWTYQDVFSTSGSCLPMTLAIIPQGGQISRCPAVGTGALPFTDSEGDPYSSYNGVPAILHYQQNTNTGYVNVIVQPVKRVSVLLGYEITSDTGDNTWLRADTLAPFRVPVDAANNVVYAGNVLAGPQVGYALGPNPAVGLGPLGLNWHLPSVGVELGLTKTLAFKGVWRYYDYHEKSNPGIYIAARDFQGNTGTLSLRYSF